MRRKVVFSVALFALIIAAAWLLDHSYEEHRRTSGRTGNLRAADCCGADLLTPADARTPHLPRQYIRIVLPADQDHAIIE